MKQLGYRAIMVLCFIALLAGGTALFCARYLGDGSDWAASRVNSGVYEDGKLRRGTIYDRDGDVLFDAVGGSYADSGAVRKATLHLIGDRAGNISASATKLMADRLVGFNPIMGTAMGGHDIFLTVEASLNAAAYQALDGRKGAVAIYNYKTGELLCSVSTPTFDPEKPPKEIEGNSKYEGVYLNRVFVGLYAPGSVFKIVTTAAALEQIPDIESRSFSCSGSLELGEHTITCPKAHGEMDFARALAKSCNCVYAQLAVELGGETLQKYAESAGLQERMDISGIKTAAGSYTVAENEGDLGWSGVGQYQTMVNPAAMLRLMGAIANDGVGVTPRLLLKETVESGRTVASGRSDSERLWKAETCEKLTALMRNTVVVEYGAEKFGQLNVCAKSGTAEVGEGKRPHSWFVGFVDDENCPLAFSVIVENGGSGSAVAGGIVAKLLPDAAALLQTAEE
ncbi:MAG: penicillin-binding protein [Oscillospiraceae bacterium]|nr:penicillin-binding protein [Oscillospiraceae bacterium]